MLRMPSHDYHHDCHHHDHHQLKCWASSSIMTFVVILIIYVSNVPLGSFSVINIIVIKLADDARDAS